MDKPTQINSLTWLARVRFFLFVAILVLLPIPKAGMIPQAFILWVAACWLMSATLIPDLLGLNRQKAAGAAGFSRAKPWLWVWLFFSAICFIHWCFKVEITEFWFSGFEGATLFPGVDAVSGEAMSFARAQTLDWWAFFSCSWLMAYLASMLNLGQIKIVIWVVLAMALFEAITGMAILQSGSSTFLGWWDKEHYLADATGSFVNRNHYANFLAICLPLCLAGLIGRKPLLLNDWPLGLRLFLAAVFAGILLIAVLSSHSRMGLMVTIIAGLIWVYGRSLSQGLGGKSWLLPLAATLCLLVVMLWFGVGETTQRLMGLEDGDGRWAIWANIFDFPAQVWLTGIGPGNFSEVYALVKPESSIVFFYYAHNDYLEFLLEFGLVFGFLAVALVVYFTKRLYFSGIFLDQSGVRLAAAAGLTAVAIHAVVDFSLQIPATAVYSSLLLGLLLNTNLYNRKDNERRVKAVKTPRQNMRRKSRQRLNTG